MYRSHPELLAEKILEIMRPHRDQPYPPDKLAAKFKVTREHIVAAVSRLRSWGYIIRSDRKKRYFFHAAPDSFIPMEIAYKLGTKIIGRKVLSYKTVQSTNSIASRLAATGAAEGTLVIADHQTRGRGRLGRQWHSPAGFGLYCSLILHPKIHPTQAPGLSLVTAVALAETIASYDDLDVKIKWPNDVLISGLKVGGILTELSAEIDRVEYVIAGIGVNINQQRTDFPAELRATATSVRIGTKEKLRRIGFLQRLLRTFEKEYLNFREKGLEGARRKLLKYSYLQNKEIRLKSGRKTITGTVIDIDREGRLVIDTRDGILAVNAGEVTTR